MELTINGSSHTVDVDPTVPLLQFLRNDLELVGAKQGCAQEQCYACCVLVDGRAQPSCQLPVSRVEGTSVTTVEGLEPFHEFFEVEQAGQCGFCIAGMVVAAQGLLNQTRHPSDAQIREALDTNLCRCGVYDRVRRAIRFRLGQPEPSIWEIRRPPPLPAAGPPAMSPSLANHPDIDSWIAINAGETVTVFTGKAELGQGIDTVVARIAADELDLPLDRIVVEGPDTARSPNEGVTSGSLSTEHSGGAVRVAAAAAKAAMVARAADALAAPASSLVVAGGVITDPGSGRNTSYWELQAGRPFGVAIDPERPPPVASARGVEARPDDAAIAAPRLDLPAKVAGRASYLHDLRLPGMLFGRVVRPPGYGARLDSLDVEPIEAMPGVVAVVRDGDFVGVMAEREEQADVASDRLATEATWTSPSPTPDPFEELRAGPTIDYDVVDGAPVRGDPVDGAPVRGDPVDGAPVRGDPVDHASMAEERMIAATYSKPFTLHGSLGPSAAVALMEGDHLTVWSHTQGVFVLRGALAEALGIGEELIRVIHRQGPGCYGHNGADDAALDAALLARAVPGRPVRLVWSRADEHRWEPLGPAMIVRLAGHVEGDRITTIDSENWSYSHVTRPRWRGDGGSDLLAAWHRAEPMTRPTPAPVLAPEVGAHRNSNPIYAVARRRIHTHLLPSTSYRTSALRGLGAFANVFAIESFVDELALRAGIDPITFRLANLDDPRAVAVVEAVADAAAWSGDPDPGAGRGVGFARYKNAQTYLAVVVDVSVDHATGVIAIDRATVAADSGRIVSPDGVSNQLEGGVVQAASWTLKERVCLPGIDAEPSIDWDTYPILRFSESFPVRTVLLDRPEQPSLGCGEAAQGPTAAAIANAVASATDCRLRHLPLTPDKVLDALDS